MQMGTKGQYQDQALVCNDLQSQRRHIHFAPEGIARSQRHRHRHLLPSRGHALPSRGHALPDCGHALPDCGHALPDSGHTLLGV